VWKTVNYFFVRFWVDKVSLVALFVPIYVSAVVPNPIPIANNLFIAMLLS
jgi:hypothetical protein